jgi:hypothetical protein
LCGQWRDNGLEREEHALEVAAVNSIEVLFRSRQGAGIDVVACPYAGGIEATEGFLGTIDKL